jgi:hypothetical protein
MMKRYDRAWSLGWLPMMLVVVVGLSLQACMEKGAVMVVCGTSGKGPTTQEGGCQPADATGHDATGYKGIGGPDPVPAHTPPYTCAAGTTKCVSPGATGCNIFKASAKCTNTFTYPSSGTTGTCNCPCL